MPATSPPIPGTERMALAALGSRIRARRRELGVSATATAEAAGISRVTLHRVEHGEPSVTMGAYLGVLSAIGLDLHHATEPTSQTSVLESIRDDAATTTLDAPAKPMVHLTDFPQLRAVAWHLPDAAEITEQDALNLYERNWRYVDHAAMDTHESDFVKYLADTWGGGLLLV